MERMAIEKMFPRKASNDSFDNSLPSAGSTSVECECEGGEKLVLMMIALNNRGGSDGVSCY